MKYFSHLNKRFSFSFPRLPLNIFKSERKSFSRRFPVWILLALLIACAGGIIRGSDGRALSKIQVLQG